MASYFLNDGQPDEAGDYVAVVDDAQGNRVSTFKGKSYPEMASLLLEQNERAALAIEELRRNRRPDAAPIAPAPGEPRDLTADERFRITADINDPARAPQAVVDALAAQMGMTPEVLRQTLVETSRRNRDAYLEREGQAFTAAHPEYLICPENLAVMLERLTQKGYDGTRNNLGIVYDELVLEGKLRLKGNPPDAQSQQADPAPQATGDGNPPTAQQPGTTAGVQRTPEPTPPASRPRFAASTAIRSSQVTGVRPAVTAPKYTRAQIENMSKVEYEQHLRDPKFRANVDAVYKRA